MQKSEEGKCETSVVLVSRSVAACYLGGMARNNRAQIMEGLECKDKEFRL
jgi:hypothetical protein